MIPASPKVISLSTPTALAAEFAPIIILLSPVVSASHALNHSIVLLSTVVPADPAGDPSDPEVMEPLADVVV